MLLFLCIYLIIGLIVAIWAYKGSCKIIMKCLKEAGKMTMLEKFLFMIVIIVSTLIILLTWPIIIIAEYFLQKR